MTSSRKFNSYVALSGDKSPQDYIKIGMEIEKLGYDRIFVYDDLPNYPVWPILTLIAEHTKKIEIGPCLVSGLYSHPVRIARNIIFLQEISNGRAVLGVGKGAFFDLINNDFSKKIKTDACKETVDVIKNILNEDSNEYKGEFFSKAKNLKLISNRDVSSTNIILGSFDKEMAYYAGQTCDEFQTGENWDWRMLENLSNKVIEGNKENTHNKTKFSIGGVTCISYDEKKAFDLVRPLLVQYIPYLSSLVECDNSIISHKDLEKIKYYSSINDIKKASLYISDEVVDKFALVGSPTRVRQKLNDIQSHITINGVSFGPPYGTYDTISENLEFIMNEVLLKL